MFNRKRIQRLQARIEELEKDNREHKSYRAVLRLDYQRLMDLHDSARAQMVQRTLVAIDGKGSVEFKIGEAKERPVTEVLQAVLEHLGLRVEPSTPEPARDFRLVRAKSKPVEAPDLELSSALNRVNQAQKALDDRLESMRSSAPRDSDWARAEHKSRKPVAPRDPPRPPGHHPVG